MKKNYPITATFLDEITYDIPSSNWTRKQWCKDLDHMKKVGIDTIVFIRGGFYDKAVFPSKHFSNLQEENDDFAGMIFQEAAKRNMKVFMGLYISNITWNDGDAQGEIEKNKRALRREAGIELPDVVYEELKELAEHHQVALTI